MNKKTKWPSFIFEENIEMLIAATEKALSIIDPISITQKDLDLDLKYILEATQDILAQNSLYITQRVIYDGQSYALSTVLHHSVSGEYYERRDQVSKSNAVISEQSVKFLKIQAYISLLTLDITNEDDFILGISSNYLSVSPKGRKGIEEYLKCPRNFYYRMKNNIKTPYQPDEGVLALAVDNLLKKEFAECRRLGKPHPIMQRNGIEGIPFKNTNIKWWQKSNYGNGGVKYFDRKRNILLSGVIDEIYQDYQGNLIIIDFKTTSKESLSLNDEFGPSYIRQISTYAFILRGRGFPVNPKGYLVVARPLLDSKYTDSDILFNRIPDGEYVFNPRANANEYKQIIEFETSIVEVPVDYSVVEKALDDIINCLNGNEQPNYCSGSCYNCELERICSRSKA